MTSEGAPQMTGWLRHPSGPKGEFNGGRLEDDFNHFLNPDAFAQGEMDEGVLRDIEHEPPAHIHSLDTPGKISHLAKESSEVLHLSQTADLMALISTTSHSLMTSLPMPQALIDNLFRTSVLSGASEDVADTVSEDKFHDVIEVSSEKENAQPESPEELMLWQEQMKTTLQDYLKDKQPLGAIKVEESARCDTLQHELLEELVLGHEQRRKKLPNNQKDGKPLGPIEIEEGTPCNLLQCISNVLDTNLESCWCFDGVSTPLEKKSLKRLMKMGKSWLNDGMVAIALEVLCQGYPSWGTAEPLALASLNATSKVFKNIMKELSLRFAHAVSDIEHPFEFIVSKDVPRQKDSINCGVYTVVFAWYLLCHGRPPCSEDKFWLSEGFVPEPPLSGYTRSRQLTQAPAKIRLDGSLAHKHSLQSKAKERKEDDWERWDCCVRFAQGRDWNSIEPPTHLNSNGTEETPFPRPEACLNVAHHEMSQQGAIVEPRLLWQRQHPKLQES
ncbi:hypothetical protein F5146DRAFT_1123920 [Armillaria mellea]|nr:hypothetical protein F5146DRAFT_1123920 [Armillaria mellea]